MRSPSCATSRAGSSRRCSPTAGWWRRSSRSPPATGWARPFEANTHRSLAPAVESAAYFVIAEALTNTAKHAGARRSWVRLADEHRALRRARGRRRPRRRRPRRLGACGPARPRGGPRRHPQRREPRGRGHGGRGQHSVRVVIAEDLALLREGLVALLRENEIEVVAQVEDGPGLLQGDRRARTGPRDRRRAPAADVQRRGPAGGDRGAPPPAGARACSCSPSTSRRPTPAS